MNAANISMPKIRLAPQLRGAPAKLRGVPAKLPAQLREATAQLRWAPATDDQTAEPATTEVATTHATTEVPTAEVLMAETIDPDLGVLSGIGVFRGPIGDLAAGAGVVAVTNFGDSSVSLLNVDDLTVAATVALPGDPFAVAVAGHHAYVGAASSRCDFVAAIDTENNRVTATYPLALRLAGLAVDRDGKRVFAATTGHDVADLAIIDTATDRVSAVEIASGVGVVADAVRISPDGRRVYVAVSDACRGYLVVVAVDQARVTTWVGVGAPIRDLAVSPDGSAVYVLTYDPSIGGAVHVVDTTTHQTVDTIAIGGANTQLTLSADGTRAYVVDADHVAVIDTTTHETVDTIGLGAPPSCVAASADGTQLYVADYAGVVTIAPVTPSLPADVVELLGALPEIRELEPAT